MGTKDCDKKRVLIVDDDSATRELYGVIVSEYLSDISVDLAVNGLEAVTKFEALHHGVVVMDLHMPVMDGIQAYRRIEELCQKKKWTFPAVVFCTAYAPPDTLSDIIEENKANCLLKKPMTGDQLVDAIRERL